jgi:hypothetical protein
LLFFFFHKTLKKITAFETIMQATVITVPMTLSVLNFKLTAKACGLVLLARLVLAHL